MQTVGYLSCEIERPNQSNKQQLKPCRTISVQGGTDLVEEHSFYIDLAGQKLIKDYKRQQPEENFNLDLTSRFQILRSRCGL